MTKRKQRWTYPEILAEIQEAARQGFAINTIGLQVYKRGLARAAMMHYGSLRKAARAAGVAYTETRFQATRESVVAELRKLQAAGIRMRATEIYAANPSLAYASRKCFGSLGGAMEAVGIPLESAQKWEPLKEDCPAVKTPERPLFRPVEPTPFPSVKDEFRHKYKTVAATGQRPKCGYF